ncbi:MAG: geranylgeranylglycerol-phosphate geranylgeranyltransferase [Bacteroidota bacterium]
MIRKLLDIMKLVRFPNLVIIILTQMAMRYLILEPLLPSAGFTLQFDHFHFMLLSLATVLIAAGGYIINDYFDTQTDWINRPDRVVVGVSVTRRTAILLHTLLNILGVGIGIYLSFYIHVRSLSIIFLVATGLLWFYSTDYKRQFLVGNLSVAFLTGLVPLMVVLFEIPLLNKAYGHVMLLANSNFNYMFAWVAGFSFFAFITTLIREIIKDLEDFKGDKAYGMKTLPIVLGANITRGVIVFLILGTVGAIVFVLAKYLLFSESGIDMVSLVYISLTLIVPMLVLVTMVLLAREQKDYHRASVTTKLIMLAGILYTVVVAIILKSGV